jgi:hypothetical protein
MDGAAMVHLAELKSIVVSWRRLRRSHREQGDRSKPSCAVSGAVYRRKSRRPWVQRPSILRSFTIKSIQGRVIAGLERLMYFPISRCEPSRLASISPWRAPEAQSNRTPRLWPSRDPCRLQLKGGNERERNMSGHGATQKLRTLSIFFTTF